MHARSGRFPLFDSLRAIAALLVLGVHAAYFSGALADEAAVRPYAARLDVGVTIFFVISGFLLYRPFVQARFDDDSPPRTLPYAWRRFLRIVPAYWVALAVTALALGLAGVFTVQGIPTYFGFAQIYRHDYSLGGLTQAWTLCVEVTFYAFLPLYALVMRRLPGRSRRGRMRGELWGLAALVLVAVVYQAVLVSSADDPNAASDVQGLLYLPAFLDQFAIGMGLAVASVALADREVLPGPLRTLERFPGLAWAGALVAFWAVSTQIGLDGRGGLYEPRTAAQYFEHHYLFAAIGLGVVLPAVFGDQSRGFVRRLLANRVLLYLGLVSYGIYLYQQLVYVQLDRWGFASGTQLGFLHPYLIWLGVGIIGSVVLASISYWLMERPLLRLKRLVPARREMPGEPGPGPGEPGPDDARAAAGVT
jgi:peptidoglycan/LPS O-acetylase OafA/YrhL